MQADLWALYRQMLRSRLFEEAVSRLWDAGLISGEMHLGLGEEAIVAGVNAHLQEGDALALDHRGTPPLIMRGVDPISLLHEFMGHPQGLCRGQGGHMHLFAPEYLAASSGIVGASGPAAAGFALAAQHLRPGTLAVAYFGEGATNQGMLLEAMNLAVVWRLPVLFVCKNNDWAITTRSSETTGGDLSARASSFGLHALEVDGTDVVAVWQAASEASVRIRRGEGPVFLHAHCIHLESHFLGDLPLRIARSPLKELPKIAWPLLKSFLTPGGAPLRARLRSLRVLLNSLWKVRAELAAQPGGDPIAKTRQTLSSDLERLRDLENAVRQEIDAAVAQATSPALVERKATA